jgi:general secretion pathway protein D
VQYVEVGIKIEAEPTIYADGEVAIRMSLEVSNAGKPNADAAKTGTIAYTIGTRSVNTVLRLKDGQTEVLGGLIQDEDINGIAGVPGLVDVPILGRLFGKQSDTKNKKEIIMSITPRIIRNNRQIDSDLLEMWSGTENNMRFGARQLGSPKPQATASGSGQPTVGVAPAATATPAPAVNSATRPVVAPAPSAPPTPAAAPAAAKAAAKAVTLAQKQATSPVIAPTASKPLPLRPLTLVVPKSVTVGETINVMLSYPALNAATNLETTLNFDADRLRLVNVTDADSTKNATEGIRFTGEADGNSGARIELAAGRGETLPANGGPLANLQFEVLQTTGPTQLTVDRAAYVSVENGSQALPIFSPIEIDVKPKP